MSFRYHICIVAGLMVTAVGCGQPNASFPTSERTSSLIKQARQGVKVEVDGKDVQVNGVEGYLSENFGTPHDLVAWLRLPIDFGGQAGTVTAPAAKEGEAAPESGKASKTLHVTVKDGVSIDGQASLAWLSGDSAGEAIVIDRFDAEKGTVSLPEKMTIAEGTSFVINPGKTIADGRRHYMTHCSHCHGTAGDGAGPTAEYLNPKPRDYRKGIFKFTRTKAAEKVTTDDLHRIVKLGIPGTYMPSFLLLADDERHAIIEYVRFLTMRGEFENKLVVELEESYSTAALKDRTSGDDAESKSDVMKELKTFMAEDLPGLADDAGTAIAESWGRANADESIITPTLARIPDSPESRARGRALFLSAKAKCTNCHGPNGLGNGPQTEDYEKDPASGETMPLPGLYDSWGNVVMPRNLTLGIYRGGRRPIDIFSRIYAGIKGAKMPAFGGGVLKDDEIWDLVNYVLSVPYEGVVAEPAKKEAAEAQASAANSNTDKTDASSTGGDAAATSTEGAGE